MKKAPDTAFDISDLRARSAELASWSEYQEKMAAAFAEVEELEASPGSVAMRIAAWERFVEQFEVDNPYSSEDERLRELASRRIETRRSVRSEPEPGELWVDPAIGMRFRYVPAGTFLMGSPEDEPGRFDNETRHEVTLTQGYWMGETEVTQGQWRALMGNNPSRLSSCGEDCPVEQVKWFEAVAFANALSAEAGYTACYRVAGANGNKPGEDLEYENERISSFSGRERKRTSSTRAWNCIF